VSEISLDKLNWLKSIGAKKFEHPITWHSGEKSPEYYSDEYLSETPLEVLKARHIEE